MSKYVKNKGLFGDEKEYKTLDYIHEHFDDLQPQVRRRVTNIIQGMDVAIKALATMGYLGVQAHFLLTLKEQTRQKLESLRTKHVVDSTYVDYLLNFTNARISNRFNAVRNDASIIKRMRKEEQKRG